MFKYFPSAVDPVRLAHARLNVDGSDVLPALLQQGDQVVHGHVDVVTQLLRVQLQRSTIRPCCTPRHCRGRCSSSAGT